FITDDTGARVFVSTGSAMWVVEPPLINEHPHVNDENEVLCTFLRSRGVLPTNYMGIAGDTRFYEHALTTGDPISVYGDIDEVQSVHLDGYRDAPQKIIRLNGTPDAPVIIFA